MKIIRQIITILIAVALPFATYAEDLQARLSRHVEALCAPGMEGRKAGSDGETRAAEYLYDQLEAIGVTMLTGREGDTFTIVTEDGGRISSRNIVGILEGENPALREQYLVVGAHLDHLGFYTVTVDGQPQQRIYPGACSDASGIAALIETARILKESAEPCGRSVIFVGFGAMEEQFAGSRYFATGGGFSYINEVKLMINLDMLGRGGGSNPFEIYTSVESAHLQPLLGHVLKNESVTSHPTLHNGVVFPSDFLAFKQAEIPSLTLSTGIFREYRTVKDTPDLMLYDLLASQTLYASALVRSASHRAVILGSEADTEPGHAYALGDCDIPPQFFRGPVQSFLDKWVYKYLKYPREAVADGIDGFERRTDSKGGEYYRAVVSVAFIIEADGNISNVEIERGVSEALDAEALRVVETSPKWTPGQIDGKKVRTKIVIPVEFRLKKR